MEELDEVIGAQVQKLVEVHTAEGELAEGALPGSLLLVSLSSSGAQQRRVSARTKEALKIPHSLHLSRCSPTGNCTAIICRVPC